MENARFMEIRPPISHVSALDVPLLDNNHPQLTLGATVMPPLRGFGFGRFSDMLRPCIDAVPVPWNMLRD